MLNVEDLVPNATSIYLSNNDPATGTVHAAYLAGDTTPMGRLCSADLATAGAYGWTDPATGTFYGTTARIFQSGEEMTGVATSSVTGDLGPEPRVDYGRQFAFIATDDPNIPGDGSADRVPARLVGGAGRDMVTGGFGDDLIVGGEGHDNLKGGGGNDTIVQ